MKSSAHRPDRAGIAVFAKAPVPGQVKTRLAAEIGAARAALVHEHLVEHALATAADAGLGTVELWCAPDDTDPFLARCGERYGARLCVQRGDDLGARMDHAFNVAHAASRALVLVGSDCPALRPEDLRDAADALAQHDAVFAPAEDGGYVLVGLAAPAPALFRDMPWGGADVMRRTRERAVAAGLAVKELRTLWDVDRPEDLRRAQHEGWLP